MLSRPRRSALYLPASNEKAIAKARSLPSAVVILDLEDAVAPEAKKLAREQAIAAVQEGGFGKRELVVRVNGLDTPWGKDDLAAIAAIAPGAVLVPKVSDRGGVQAYIEHLHGRIVPIWAMIETARSLFHLYEISATPGVQGLVMGLNDLAKETGPQLSTARTPFLGALGLAVAAARARGLVILDGVINDLDDGVGLIAQCRQAVEFGFDGKTLIHPSQVASCNEAFTPDFAAVAWATKILKAFDDPANINRGAIRVEGKMVERLHLHQARRTLAAASSTAND